MTELFNVGDRVWIEESGEGKNPHERTRIELCEIVSADKIHAYAVPVNKLNDYEYTYAIVQKTRKMHESENYGGWHKKLWESLEEYERFYVEVEERDALTKRIAESVFRQRDVSLETLREIVRVINKAEKKEDSH